MWPFVSCRRTRTKLTAPLGIVTAGRNTAQFCSVISYNRRGEQQRRCNAPSVEQSPVGVNRMTPTDFARLSRMTAGEGSYCYRGATEVSGDGSNESAALERAYDDDERQFGQQATSDGQLLSCHFSTTTTRIVLPKTVRRRPVIIPAAWFSIAAVTIAVTAVVVT